MFTESFEKTSQMRTYPASFDAPEETIHITDAMREFHRNKGRSSEGTYPPERAGDMEFRILRDVADVAHSPTTRGAITGAKWGLGAGLPAALVAAMAGAKGKKLKSALLLGTTFGLPVGLAAGLIRSREQSYRNKLEDAHINYHLDRMGYVPGK